MKFSLNVDHVATLRNARKETQPDPVTYALMAEQFGVDGIVVHLREDRRHINERDVRLLRELITTKLDLEMSTNDEIVRIACDIQPELATLVPEKREELTTEGGLNVIDNLTKIKSAIERLHEHEIPVSLFIEPEILHIDAAAEIKSDFIEIHTGNFANAASEDEMYEELDRINVAAKHAKKLNLSVNAGHGLNYLNMKDFLTVEDIDEVSIGQSVIARSIFVGVEQAVKEMLNLIRNRTTDYI
ncbi:MAG: pyridoxine 5'-phosphate synthase [Bacteroidetes bacterium]|nr:pyridoxine 5'-phosphate synthase [Bacteroidota bacterium]MBU1679862.1 pyridoxine 5'-phosphate synthase [Bacteroidota bacterium]MBU2507564.1 pyridoxine 5'-phosphate synthase [Bacteroidota bacterium]